VVDEEADVVVACVVGVVVVQLWHMVRERA
jgi:hypothetical protein